MKKWNLPDNRNAYRYVRHLTAYYSKSFYAATQMLPEKARWATFALYGFCRYADNLIDLPRERNARELLREVSYLREELNIAYRTGETEHPVLRPFILTAREYAIPLDYPLELLNGVEMDLRKQRYATFAELYQFAYRGAGVVGLMMTHVLGYSSKTAFQFAEKLGIALQLTNILRDVQEDKNMGRIYLPQEEMEQFDIGEDDIILERWSPRFREFMKFQVERAEHYYREAHPGIALLNPKNRFAISAASRIYGGILEKIRQNNFNPFLGRVFVSKSEKIAVLIQEWLRVRNPLRSFNRSRRPSVSLPAPERNQTLVEE